MQNDAFDGFPPETGTLESAPFANLDGPPIATRMCYQRWICCCHSLLQKVNPEVDDNFFDEMTAT
jgi:hypothetical protein